MKTEAMQKWLGDNLPLLKALKRPSEDQRDLITLTENANRSDSETKYLMALVEAEKAMQTAKAKRKAVSDVKKAEAAEARKLENGQKIIDGGWLRQQVLTNPETRDWYLKNAPKAITRKADLERMKPYWEKLAKMDTTPNNEGDEL